MPKRYNTPHRSHVVKTRLTDEEYADFTARLAPYGISQSEFLRQAIRRATIRPVVHVSSVNDELLSAVGKLKGHASQHCRKCTSLTVGIHSESSHARKGERKVHNIIAVRRLTNP